ncbi:MAG: response regulator [Paludibacter sp.]|nr:response regulator [Paludibacter sp.]
MENEKIIDILLIEDNPGDSRLVKEVFKERELKHNLIIVYDGVEATDYLFKRNANINAKRPDLIILDLNLPKKNGIEVLHEIKLDESLKSIPVIVLTTSKSEEDIINTYNSHANCYMIKPLNLNDFFETVKAIENFWLNFVKLPTL